MNRGGRTRDADGTRARILSAALELFAQRGFEGVRLREIAVGAKVTVPLLCHHFRDKETLYDAVVDQALGALARVGWDVLRSAKGIEAQLRALVHEILGVLARDPLNLAIVHRDLLDGGRRAGPIADRWLRPVRHAAVREIRAAQRRHELRRDIDPDLLLLHILGAVIYPSLAAPIVQSVWDIDPLTPVLVRKREKQLVAMIFGSIASSSAEAGSTRRVAR